MRGQFKGIIPIAVLIFLFSYFGLVQPSLAKTWSPIIYSGEALRTIAFPVGGLGTGNITIGGRGEIREMEIFNRPAKGVHPELTFFALWVKAEGKLPVAKILERKLLPPYVAWMGIPRTQLPGLPRFDEVFFRGEFPLAWLEFKDQEIPLKITLETYNPFIPLDPENSGLPVAIFNWYLQNESDAPVEVALVFSLQNPLRYTNEQGDKILGGNLNEYVEKDSWVGLRFSNKNAQPGSLEEGNLTLATSSRPAVVQTRWYRGSWWDNAHLFWDDFSADGLIKEVKDAKASPERRTDVASLLVHLKLNPGESKLIPYYLAWYFPWRENYWNREKEVKGRIFRNYYATRFADSVEVIDYLINNISELESTTKTFHDLLFSSTFPPAVLDALSSQASSLKTNLLLRTEEGKTFGFEGLTDDRGCCPMNCTHVWNYENTLAFLFPSLERSMRETDFLHNTFNNGYQVFRTLIPLGEYWWQFKPCADGQMGNIVRVYREWKLSGDTLWLKKLWPQVKKALEFAWKGVDEVEARFSWQKELLVMPWDPNRDGVMEAEQHNTYDIEFYGPNTMTGSLYLAALKAATEMAHAMGDQEAANLYSQLFQNGSKKYDELLWNGEYYIQKIKVLPGLTVPEHLQSPPKNNCCSEKECPSKKSPGGPGSALKAGEITPKYQYGEGCLSDQLLGQYLAFVTHLGYLFPPEHVKQALASIYKYNFSPQLSNFPNVQRVYALNDEAGLLLCSWPKGNRPALPFVYADEVWTGIEYQVAASLIYAGLVKEGLKIVEAVRNRYRGYNRNPWDELECGHHYARAMSSWALLLALSGFQYDGVSQKICFSPRINHENFATFWSTGSAWGSCGLDLEGATLQVAGGELTVQEIDFSGRYPWEKLHSCQLAGRKIKVRYIKAPHSSQLHRLIFDSPLRIKKGETLKIKCQ
jgi:uncharacterized protein (DUF608 family)